MEQHDRQHSRTPTAPVKLSVISDISGRHVHGVHGDRHGRKQRTDGMVNCLGGHRKPLAERAG